MLWASPRAERKLESTSLACSEGDTVGHHKNAHSAQARNLACRLQPNAPEPTTLPYFAGETLPQEPPRLSSVVDAGWVECDSVTEGWSTGDESDSEQALAFPRAQETPRTDRQENTGDGQPRLSNTLVDYGYEDTLEWAGPPFAQSEGDCPQSSSRIRAAQDVSAPFPLVPKPSLTVSAVSNVEVGRGKHPANAGNAQQANAALQFAHDIDALEPTRIEGRRLRPAQKTSCTSTTAIDHGWEMPKRTGEPTATDTVPDAQVAALAAREYSRQRVGRLIGMFSCLVLVAAAGWIITGGYSQTEKLETIRANLVIQARTAYGQAQQTASKWIKRMPRVPIENRP